MILLLAAAGVAGTLLVTTALLLLWHAIERLTAELDEALDDELDERPPAPVVELRRRRDP